MRSSCTHAYTSMQVARHMEDPQAVQRSAAAAWDKFIPPEQRRAGPIGAMDPPEEDILERKSSGLTALFRSKSLRKSVSAVGSTELGGPGTAVVSLQHARPFFSPASSRTRCI